MILLSLSVNMLTFLINDTAKFNCLSFSSELFPFCNLTRNPSRVLFFCGRDTFDSIKVTLGGGVDETPISV